MAISNRHHLPTRSSDANKYSHGKVCIIAGSDKYPGAATLCVGGARRGGVGYVNYVALSERAANLVLNAFPDVVPINKVKEFTGMIIDEDGRPQKIRKRIIDKEHKIDVSLLSYKFMKYLQMIQIQNEQIQNEQNQVKRSTHIRLLV